ncbi:MAG: response regulator [Gammaproteobacteria bacterium]|nr:response regulator [Gammaproteobacteria bacterium]
MDTENQGPENENSGSDESIVDDEIMQEFIVETDEGLQQLEVDFLSLEKEPDNTDLLNNSFRVIHTIKGTSSFLGLKNLESTTHKAEDVLNKLRKSELVLTSDIMDTLLRAIDIVKQMLDEIREGSSDATVETEDIKKSLAEILENKESSDASWEMEDTQASSKSISENSSADTTDNISDDAAVATQAQSEPRSANTFDPPPVNKAPEKDGRVKNKEASTIRIGVDKLDSLFNLVGELVLSRNRNVQLHSILSQKFHDDETITLDLVEAGNQLDHLTSDLQWAVMKTRMVPVSSVFNKFHRVVRDVAKKLNKEVELHLFGENTEIDKNIIEGIGDPLTHIIRNSADHGIDTPEERTALGKDRVGRVDLSAYYEGNYVVIEIKDDGRGIDVEAVKKKAIEKGLIDQKTADNLPKEALLNLIFQPGFSTAKTVTNVSGRGVGMDVVKTNIEKLRGQILIDSNVGKGTEMKLKIPLTLAILDTIIVRVSDQRYAVPLSNVVDTHRISYSKIERLRGNMVFRLREELIPVTSLSEIFNLPFNYDENSEVTILVLKSGFLRMGLIVDKTSGQEEVVIKPLDCLKGIVEPCGTSGATILGDGSITFILDIDALLKLSNVENRQVESREDTSKGKSQSDTDFMDVVMVDNLGKELFAIPSENVREIELIHKTEMEELNGKLVIKHRGSIVPLATISSVTGADVQREFDNYYMIVIADGKEEVGLLVGRLLGIENLDRNAIENNENKLNGIDGTTIFDDRITSLLNPKEIRNIAINQQSSLRNVITDSNSQPEIIQRNILVVDDVKMHRTIVEDAVKKAGHKPISAVDGMDALSKLDASIKLILTDLEMPNVDGYEFTREAKKRYPKIPVIMVTSMAGDEDRVKGIEAGVDKYIVKWKEGVILDAIKEFLP